MSSILRDASICFSHSLSNYFKMFSCSVYATFLGSAYYGFASTLPHHKKVPLKHLVPVENFAKLMYF